MKGRNVLVTGGAGFIGSNFVRKLVKGKWADSVVTYDKLTYAGNRDNLADIESFMKHLFVRGDICDRERVENIFRKEEINYIVNFAAETHVDRSISNDCDFIRTNVEGTRVLLEIARKYGVEKFIQIGTDEVYGSLKTDSSSSRENDLLIPRSPYSASKASADLLTLSYFYTHGLPVCVTRSSNNYGPYQFPEKVMPLFITNLIEGKKVPLYGDGKNIRDWIYVEDNCDAIEVVLKDGKLGEIYNIGGGNEMSNIDLTKMILAKMGHRKDWMDSVEFVEDRKGHDKRYSLDCSKIKRELDWKPEMHFDIGILKTIKWYKENEDWWRGLKSGR